MRRGLYVPRCSNMSEKTVREFRSRKDEPAPQAGEDNARPFHPGEDQRFVFDLNTEDKTCAVERLDVFNWSRSCCSARRITDRARHFDRVIDSGYAWSW